MVRHVLPVAVVLALVAGLRNGVHTQADLLQSRLTALP